MSRAIEVTDVSKIYKLYDNPMDRFYEALGIKNDSHKEFYALKGVTFNIYKGETVGIIGTNGSGKSTILKIITGVLGATSGSVRVDGRISALLELGAGFNGEYTGIENIYLNGTMMGYTREEIDKKMKDIIEFADIGDFINQPVKSYSSGMFVRLAFAVAINIDPEILIVDEALSVGDIFFQAKCYKKFEEFKAQGKTILLVTHDLGSVMTYCDRAIVLNKGNKISEGSPKEMVDLYKKILANGVSKLKEEKKRNADQFTSNQSLERNSNCLEYGNKKAVIKDFYIKDNEGMVTNCIEKGTKFSIGMAIEFYEDIQEPIFAFTIKNVKGIEITGTNTKMEKRLLKVGEAGKVYSCKFEQEMNLQGGDYLLSLGCTSFVNEGLEIYHRLYDVCRITVISDKNTVGFYDMNAEVTYEF